MLDKLSLDFVVESKFNSAEVSEIFIFLFITVSIFVNVFISLMPFVYELIESYFFSLL